MRATVAPASPSVKGALAVRLDVARPSHHLLAEVQLDQRSAAPFVDAEVIAGVRLLILGGEACPAELGWRLAARLEVWNTYGPTGGVGLGRYLDPDLDAPRTSRRDRFSQPGCVPELAVVQQSGSVKGPRRCAALRPQPARFANALARSSLRSMERHSTGDGAGSRRVAVLALGRRG